MFEIALYSPMYYIETGTGLKAITRLEWEEAIEESFKRLLKSYVKD